MAPFHAQRSFSSKAAVMPRVWRRVRRCSGGLGCSSLVGAETRTRSDNHATTSSLFFFLCFFFWHFFFLCFFAAAAWCFFLCFFFLHLVGLAGQAGLAEDGGPTSLSTTLPLVT